MGSNFDQVNDEKEWKFRAYPTEYLVGRYMIIAPSTDAAICIFTGPSVLGCKNSYITIHYASLLKRR